MCQVLAEQFTVAMRSTGKNSLLTLCNMLHVFQNVTWQLDDKLLSDYDILFFFYFFLLHCITIDTGGW